MHGHHMSSSCFCNCTCSHPEPFPSPLLLRCSPLLKIDRMSCIICLCQIHYIRRSVFIIYARPHRFELWMRDRRCKEFFFLFVRSIENVQASDKVLQAVEKALRESPFFYQGARILSGQEEGAFGWVTVNYLDDRLTQVIAACNTVLKYLEFFWQLVTFTPLRCFKC